MDPYKILGVNPGASSQEITKAYTEMIKRYRSDRFADTVLQEVAQQKLQEVEQAYLVLIGDMNESPGLRDELSGEQTAGEINTYQQSAGLFSLRLERPNVLSGLRG